MKNPFRRNRTPDVVLTGNGAQLSCDAVPTDVILVELAPSSKIGKAVGIAIVDRKKGSHEAVVLTAQRARVLAAAILNVADEVEGRTPLSFTPES